MAKKTLSYTKTGYRKIKTKSGPTRTVVVKGHYNKLNRKPKKP
jgi:hypothetical protein